MPRKKFKYQTPYQEPLTVLPEPSFKHGSSTYVLLTFAKSMNRPFSVSDIRNCTARYSSDYEVKRSIAVLIKNNSLEVVDEEHWKITSDGIHQVFDFARRRVPTSVDL